MSSFNLGQRLFVDDDGILCTITNMLDADGDETDDCADARMIVVRRSANEWLTVDVVNDCANAVAA